MCVNYKSCNWCNWWRAEEPDTKQRLKSIRIIKKTSWFACYVVDNCTMNRNGVEFNGNEYRHLMTLILSSSIMIMLMANLFLVNEYRMRLICARYYTTGTRSAQEHCESSQANCVVFPVNRIMRFFHWIIVIHSIKYRI